MASSVPANSGPALLLDAADGKVLYSEDADHQWYPASLTKIMTAYLTFEALRAGKLTLDAKIPCSETAHVQEPGKVGLPVGATMTVDLALQALIIKSANDVAVMLAEAVGGSAGVEGLTSLEAFIQQMNATAQRLGMTRTKFVNPNGLPAAEQVTTARDLAKLSRAVVRDFPEYQSYWELADMRLGKRRMTTHNSLLKTYEGADGLKTGFICDSGYNVIASATRNGRRLIAVVLGEASLGGRALRARHLLEHGFQNYAWKVAFDAANVDSLPVAADAKGIVSIRESVTDWDCGRRRRVRAPRSKTKPKPVAQNAAAEQAKPKPKATQAQRPAAKTGTQ